MKNLIKHTEIMKNLAKLTIQLDEDNLNYYVIVDNNGNKLKWNNGDKVLIKRQNAEDLKRALTSNNPMPHQRAMIKLVKF